MSGSASFATASGLGDGSVTFRYLLPAPTAPTAPAGACRFVPLSPNRLLDTRVASDITNGAPVVPASSVDLQVTGRSGVPSTNVSAVVLNVTAAQSTAPGYVTVWPTGQARPTASNLNVTVAGQNIANLVTVQLGAGGQVSLYSQSGTDLVVDVAGYFEPVSVAATAGVYSSLSPTRILDTRMSLGVAGTSPVAADKKIDLVVTGVGGVPAAGVSAVVLNVTAAEATAAGFVTVWPAGQAMPTASNLNVTFAGQNIANQVIVPVGSNGSISLYTQSGTHLVADVSGWFSDATRPPSLAGLFVPLTPTRILDTRVSLGVATTTPVAPNASIDLSVLGRGGVPATGVGAVTMNVTAAEPTAPGYVTVWPASSTRPTVSNLNVTFAGQNIANLATVGIGAAGSTLMYSQSGTHFVADVAGYYTTGS